ncbi:MAG: NUDIX domain-containing protein [Lachnospiraceae bacterium]|nr:NUDIX domain-containing protein [Lachnospiraceae bacterium]
MTEKLRKPYNPQEDNDILDIYNQNGIPIGTCDRKTVHDNGLWHYAMHCWLYTEIDNTRYVIFQKRQIDKRIFPNKLDVAAAGHYIAGEKFEDGLRELIEELNINPSDIEVSFYKTEQFSYEDSYIKNNEFWNIYICHFTFKGYDFAFDESEVQDVLFLPLNQTLELMQSKGKGFMLGFSAKEKKTVKIVFEDFVTPYKDYFLSLLEVIKMRGVK